MIVEPDFFNHWKTQLLVTLVAETATELCRKLQEEPSGNLALTQPKPRALAGFGYTEPWLNPQLIQPEASPLWVQKLWAHCQTRKAWIFPGMTPSQLRAVCGAPLPPDRWRDILLECRFIETDGMQVVVHEWEIANAGMIRSWLNGGKSGGRPKTQPKPRVNPDESDRVDRVDRIPPIVPQGGQSGEGSSISGTVPSRPAGDSVEKKERGAADMQPAEAIEHTVRLCCELFDRKQNVVSAAAMHALREVVGALPLDELRWAALRKMREARKKSAGAPEELRLRVRWLESADALAMNLLEAADRALEWAREQVQAEAAKDKTSLHDEVAGWRGNWDAVVPVPYAGQQWQDLPDYIRQDFVKHSGKGAA